MICLQFSSHKQTLKRWCEASRKLLLLFMFQERIIIVVINCQKPTADRFSVHHIPCMNLTFVSHLGFPYEAHRVAVVAYHRMELMNLLTPTPNSHPRVRESSTSPSRLQKCELLWCCFSSDMLICCSWLWSRPACIWMCVNMWMQEFNRRWGGHCPSEPSLYPPPFFSKHLLPAYSRSEFSVSCCNLLGVATLTGLLMTNVPLITVFCLCAAICTSWLANPLPTVWCWGGACWGACDAVPLPNYKGKRSSGFIIKITRQKCFCHRWDQNRFGQHHVKKASSGWAAWDVPEFCLGRGLFRRREGRKM